MLVLYVINWRSKKAKGVEVMIWHDIREHELGYEKEIMWDRGQSSKSVCIVIQV